MKLKCMLGRHNPIKDYSRWSDGYHLSACADCGEPMKKAPGGHWRVLRAGERDEAA
jgi:hypothetical protein